MALVLADLLNETHVDLDLRTRPVGNGPGQTGEAAARRMSEFANPTNFSRKCSRVSGSVQPWSNTESPFHTPARIWSTRSFLPSVEAAPELSSARRVDRARLIFLIGVPRRLISDYLVCVGALARLLKDAEVRQRLLYAETPKEFLDILREPDETRFD